MPLLLAALLGLTLQDSSVTLATASNHPIQYYYSLPLGWSKDKTWPVVIAIESADRDFKKNAEDFVKARGDRPYIIVVPENVTGGGPTYKEAMGSMYSPSVWAQIDRDPWAFDVGGISAIISDVQSKFGGEPKPYLTGWEAGAHTVWALAFTEPEKWAAVATVAPNYQKRHIVSFSAMPERAHLPIRTFVGQKDAMWDRYKSQYDKAKEDAWKNGFSNITYEIVQGEGHGPLADAVLSWFDMLRGG